MAGVPDDYKTRNPYFRLINGFPPMRVKSWEMERYYEDLKYMRTCLKRRIRSGKLTREERKYLKYALKEVEWLVDAIKATWAFNDHVDYALCALSYAANEHNLYLGDERTWPLYGKHPDYMR